jgi:threonine/homoserine/homoserine lactone efflux protein
MILFPLAMILLDTSLTFLGVSLLLGFAPGPDNLFVMLQSAVHGRKAGMCVVLGLCTGLVVHTALVVFGVAALLAASAMAFFVLKLLGAAYLAYLAWLSWRTPAEQLTAGGAPALRPARLYARGIVMNLSNPKVVLFFLAFLPQFVHPALGSVPLQLCWLGVLFILATLLSFGLINWFAAALGDRLRRSSDAQRLMNRLAAVVFLALALRLLVASV